MKKFKKCPVVLLILVTGLLFQGIGVRGAQGIYRHIASSAGYEPGFASVFRGAHEGIYPWSGLKPSASGQEAGGTETGVLFSGSGNGLRADSGRMDSIGAVSCNTVSGHTVSGNAVSCNTVSGHTVSGNAVSGNRVSVNRPSGNSMAENPISGHSVSSDRVLRQGTSVSSDTVLLPDSSEIPETTLPSETAFMPESSVLPEETAVFGSGVSDSVPEKSPVQMQTEPVSEPAGMFRQVEEDYFDDALFIGDSRTVGLFEYGRMGDHARCYAKTSMTVYDIFENEKTIVDPGDGRDPITVEQALTENQFGKIYIMIGLNEMGTGTAESFFRSYAAVVERIRELQPEALIYIQGIMRVAAEKNETDPIFNNANINQRNEMLAGLADQQNIFYLEINEAVCDESGCLFSDWTFDQIHLKAAYYKVWKAYLMEHGVVR